MLARSLAPNRMKESFLDYISYVGQIKIEASRHQAIAKKERSSKRGPSGKETALHQSEKSCEVESVRIEVTWGEILRQRRFDSCVGQIFTEILWGSVLGVGLLALSLRSLPLVHIPRFTTRLVKGPLTQVRGMDISPFQPVDRISNLPDNVIDKILMHFTIRDSAKTSILSKQWRYKWLNLPQLIFDDTLWQESARNQELARMKFVGILYQVLFRHQGPVTKISLIIPKLRGGSEIDHLIYILWKKGVEEFTLKMTVGEEYKLPSSLFMCLQLKHLSLSSCLINPPPIFKGFNRLIRLELDFVTIDARELNSPHLAIVSVTCGGGCDFGDGIRILIEFFDSVPALQKLHMDYNFVKTTTKQFQLLLTTLRFSSYQILRVIGGTLIGTSLDEKLPQP
ncbi:F-box/FBD/LRR-repeat protein [Forsythia ovata]|uniref:F-box/FBD/LRR-repeat protein n=1 Tax=Forsythia ovata TaxID=205694 RepID=A0ABD1WPE0_9LAMI